MSKQGKLIVIVAPSGSGKSTLIKMLRKELPNLKESVSTTTRPIREGEIEGKSYFFVDEKSFEERKERGEFIEWAKVHGNYYGTSKTFVEEQLNAGESLLFDLDVQGTDAMKKVFGDQAKAIFIAPPSLDTLSSRLKGRGTDSTGVIDLRLANATKELERKNDFDFLVINDDLDRAFQDLMNVVNGIIAENS